jgi:hypothetical protein
MPKDADLPPREFNTEDVIAVAAAAAPPKPSLARRHWGKLTLLALVGIPLMALLAWTWSTLSFTYSSGNRVGYVQKLSRKGWLCKTWEGELQISSIPGSAPVLFQFTVRSDSVARAIEGLLGSQLELQYEEHPGVPLSCFGDTPYFVVGVRKVGR